MPKDTSIKKILVIGSGPIVIGQGCEFDYSGTQACKALREEGYEVVLVNSNPATIMTDPETAPRTYIEPSLLYYFFEWFNIFHARLKRCSDTAPWLSCVHPTMLIPLRRACSLSGIR